MAWTVDNLSIGNSGSASNAAFTTTATVATGAWIFIYCGHFGATAIASCSDNSGNGYSYELVGTATNGSVRVGLFRAYASAGLASGTVITFVGFNGNQHIAGCSFTGSNDLSTAGTAATNTGSTAAHSVTPTTPGDNALAIQCTHVNNTTANTPDANSTELQDFSAGGAAQRGIMQYRICGAAGAYTLGGTAGATTWASVGVGFTLSDTVFQQFLPDADTTTTGWTSTPLFSKINDSSDATVITGTLS